MNRWKQLTFPGTVFIAFWILGIAMWNASGAIAAMLFFGAIGSAAGLGLGLYALLPKARKPIGRKVALLLIGSFLMTTAAILDRENMQLEGMVFGLLGGVYQAAVIHYLVAKVFGPMLFGRIWCGWGCWTVMVLDLLPFRRSPGRLPGRLGWLRYAHFALSVGSVVLLWFGFGYRVGGIGRAALVWHVAGNALYYAVGIGLAVLLKDNRAFCKYVCPVAVPLKLFAPLSLVKVRGDAARCTGCNACTQACPMDIRVSEYIRQGRRVLSTECTLCQTCISACANDVLKLSAGLDLGGQDLLRLQ